MSDVLSQRLKKISSIFDIKTVLKIKSNQKTIAHYYKVNRLSYNLFHRGEDFIHMGISRNKKFSKNDLYAQPKIVESYLVKNRTKRVLELATGRGASSAYLAKRHPNIIFYGVDLPDGQINYAYKKAKRIKNYLPSEGDYHNLQNFPAGYFDVVFVIEALCYSKNKEGVLQQVKRVLGDKGIFIIFDGYCKKKNDQLSENEHLAKKLTEKGMIVDNFDYYEEFKNKALKNFKVLHEEDASFLILPTLERFEKQAQFFYSLPSFLIKILLKILPQEFLINSISGYLMPVLIKLEVAIYEILVLQKR